jgi:spore coat polysaccharide biosynthesis protein SpsF
MKTVIIVQARMGSTRLPGKVLWPFTSRPMICSVVERLKACKEADEICLATPDTLHNLVATAWAETLQVRAFRGSEHDVLSRYLEAATASDADIVVRVTGDCPLIDPRITDDVIRLFKTEGDSVDYAANILRRTFPRGLDVEVFRTDLLRWLDKQVVDPQAREHVTLHIYREPEKFSVLSLVGRRDLSQYRWTVDVMEDALFMKKIFKAVESVGSLFSFETIVELLERNTDWIEINARIQQAVSVEVPRERFRQWREVRI